MKLADIILIIIFVGEIILYFNLYRKNKLSLFSIFFPLIVNIILLEFVLENSRSLVQFTKFLFWFVVILVGIKFKDKYNLD